MATGLGSISEFIVIFGGDGWYHEMPAGEFMFIMIRRLRSGGVEYPPGYCEMGEPDRRVGMFDLVKFAENADNDWLGKAALLPLQIAKKALEISLSILRDGRNTTSRATRHQVEVFVDVIRQIHKAGQGKGGTG